MKRGAVLTPELVAAVRASFEEHIPFNALLGIRVDDEPHGDPQALGKGVHRLPEHRSGAESV